MEKRMIVLIPISFILVWAVFSMVSKPRLTANPASVAEVESYIGEIVDRQQPPGLSVVVVKDGAVVYDQAFGWADGPSRLPAGPDTVYHWWSMTKVATAIAVLQLHDANLLDIDDPVRDYLPFFQPTLDGSPASPITIRQVLRHTSGLPDTIPAMIGWVHYEDEIYNQTELLQKHLPAYNRLKFAPDTRFAYSNLGYLVLGAVIEAASGQRYEVYIQEHLLTPLGMNHTSFLYTSQMSGQIAAGSHPVLSMYTPLLPFLLDMKALVRERAGSLLWFNPVYIDTSPPSGLIGPANDVALLAVALLNRDSILSPESHALLLPQGPSLTGRPLGWAEYSTGHRLWVGHSGGGPGFATIMRLYPEENLAIILMANNTDLPREALVEAFAGLDWE